MDRINYPAALRYLSLFTDYERANRVLLGNSVFRLRRMARLLRGLGNPHRRVPVVHVTGSKGKGSVSTILAELVRAHGLRVGLCTSPHLVDLRERVRIDGAPIAQAAFARCLARVLDVILARPADREWVERALADGAARGGEPVPDRFPTFFEILTAIAFLHFVERRVDLAVVEVGLGGRLDATNLVRPLVSVITRIELEHTDVLGDTLEAIAREKAGIVKRGAPVVTGERQKGPLGVIRAIARSRGTDVSRLGREYCARMIERLPGIGMRCTFDALGFSLRDVRVPLLGAHHMDNIMMALGVIGCLREHGLLQPDERALRRAVERLVVPARAQVIPLALADGPRTLLLDCCHTRDSALALAKVVKAHWPRARRWLLFGALRGKDIDGMLEILAPCFSRILPTPVASPRSWDPEDALPKYPRESFAPVGDASFSLEAAVRWADQWDLLVVAGSVYLAGEVLRALESAKRRGRDVRI